MWAQRLTDQFIRDGIVLPENAEIVQYGLEALAGNLFSGVITLGIGYCFGSALSGIVLWILIFPLRKYAGGYHAKTRRSCFFISIGMLLLAFTLLYRVDWHLEIYFFVAIISGIYIFLNAPIGNASKVLDVVEQKVYRKRTRIILILESALFAMAWVFECEVLLAVIAMCFGIVGMLLVMGKHSC